MPVTDDTPDALRTSTVFDWVGDYAYSEFSNKTLHKVPPRSVILFQFIHDIYVRARTSNNYTYPAYKLHLSSIDTMVLTSALSSFFISGGIASSEHH